MPPDTYVATISDHFLNNFPGGMPELPYFHTLHIAYRVWWYQTCLTNQNLLPIPLKLLFVNIINKHTVACYSSILIMITSTHCCSDPTMTTTG